MITYKAIFQGNDEVVYSFDAAKAWVAGQAGRTFKWRESADGKAWFAFRTRDEADSADPHSPTGYLARIVASTHPEF